MRLRTTEEQKAYLDGYEMCAECIQDYITEEGRVKLDCLLKSVKNAINIEDVNDDYCADCSLYDGISGCNNPCIGKIRYDSEHNRGVNYGN